MVNAASDHDLLCGWLAERDEVCPACGYQLRGLVTERCVECGHALRLTVRAPRMTLVPWALTMVWLSFAAGFDLVAGSLMGVTVVRMSTLGYRWPTRVLEGLGVLVLMGVVSATLVLWVLSSRTKWTRASAARQWMVTIAVAMIVFVVHAGVGFWLWATVR